MPIKGLENMTSEQIEYELRQGAKFIVFEYCISLLVVSFKRVSSIYFIKKDDSAFVKGIPFSIISLIFGWWGIPWGIFYTISSVFNNLKGGKDMTKEVLEALQK